MGYCVRIFSVCTSCGSGFNVAHIDHGEYNMPPLLPKVAGVCDNCGTASLVQRPDDTAEVVKQRCEAHGKPTTCLSIGCERRTDVVMRGDACRLEVYNDETAPLIDFYAATGVLRTFEVKRGLADLDQLVDLINAELGA